MERSKRLAVKGNAICGRLVKILSVVSASSLFVFPAYAAEGTTLTFNFNPSEMFTWTNTMLSALMPVLYITLGISLAFIIINALKYAFR